LKNLVAMREKQLAERRKLQEDITREMFELNAKLKANGGKLPPRTLAEQWDDIDFDAVGLFRHLCRYSYEHAAIGLLEDLCRETCLAWAGEHPEPLPDGTTMGDALLATYRERLMEILGDADGGKLKEWLAAYRVYVPNLDDPFVQLAACHVGTEIARLRAEAREE
jgi:hypothetical protein